METKKYELTNESITLDNGTKLYHIRALKDFGDVKAGEIGGYVQGEKNLSQEGNAWVYDDARVSGNAEVCGDARVFGNAWVSGNAWVYDDARVSGNAEVCGDAWVFGDAWVSGDAWVESNNDLCLFNYFGSSNRTTTAFKTRDGNIGVRCGCFQGTLQQFREKVKETHGTNDYAVEYLMIADLIEHKLSGRNKEK